MFVLSLLANSDDNGGSATGAAVQIGILLLIPIGMYFLMIRPQRRRMRQQAEMQSSLGVGDEVITTAGIYGFITGFDGDRVWLEIDDDVQVRVARAALQGKVDTTGSAQAPTKSDSGTDTGTGTDTES